MNDTILNGTVKGALLGWVVLVIVLFAILPSRRALLIGMIGGWLFLPCAIWKIKAIPEFSKITAASYACLLGTFLFDWKRLAAFRLKWYDIPMVVYCLTPIITSMQNGLGFYDGISNIVVHIITWGIPYYLGRVYFQDWESFRELGVAIVVGGLIYVPLCLYEIRMSPQLHTMVYGFSPVPFVQTMRMGGYRPNVFLQHGLAVGMWMTSASLVGLWMWQCKALKSVMGIPMFVLVPTLLVTTLLCKSTGGLLFLAAGIGILYSILWTRTPIFLLIVLSVAPAYMYIRASRIWDGASAVVAADKFFGPERAQSLGVRIHAENVLADHALEQPWFGWGRWNRNRVYDIRGKDMAPTDGLWILTLGVDGVVGLVAFTLAILLPPLLVWARCPLKMWKHPGVAPAVAMAVLLSLYMLDNILNAMPDPIFTLALGGLAGIGPSIRKQVKAAKAAGQDVAMQPARVVAPAAFVPAQLTPGFGSIRSFQ